MDSNRTEVRAPWLRTRVDSVPAMHNYRLSVGAIRLRCETHLQFVATENERAGARLAIHRDSRAQTAVHQVRKTYVSRSHDAQNARAQHSKTGKGDAKIRCLVVGVAREAATNKQEPMSVE